MNYKIIDEYAFNELNGVIQDQSSKYFGGVVAYLSLSLNISLFIKLMKKIKERKKEDVHTYDVLITLSKSIYDSCIDLAESDSEIFAKISSKSADDRFIEDALIKQTSFITNLNMLKLYIVNLIQTSKGSIVADYQMISEAIDTTRNNVIGIIKYEIKKFSSEELKAIYSVRLSSF